MLFSKDSHGYVYKWTELSTGKWYIGSRSAKNCHVNDGYTCSSKLVKQLILENSNNWSREILWVGDRQSAVQIESLILQLLNAAKDPDSYNQSNANGKFYTSGMVAHNRGKLHSEESKRKMSEKRSNPSLETRMKISEARKGKSSWNKGISHTEETKNKIREKAIGRKHTKAARRKMSENNKGRIVSNETRNKISATVVGRKKSIDHCKNLTLAMLNREKKECVHCNKLVDAMNYSKWHGDNCKIINPSRPGNINLIGSKRSLETREKMSVKIKNRIKVKCVHCSKIINQAAHTRYHGDKCKLNTINTI